MEKTWSKVWSRFWIGSDQKSWIGCWISSDQKSDLILVQIVVQRFFKKSAQMTWINSDQKFNCLFLFSVLWKVQFQIFEKTELNRFSSKLWSKSWIDSDLTLVLNSDQSLESVSVLNCFQNLLKWLESILIQIVVKSQVKNKFKILKKFSSQFF